MNNLLLVMILVGPVLALLVYTSMLEPSPSRRLPSNLQWLRRLTMKGFERLAVAHRHVQRRPRNPSRQIT